VAFLPSYSYSDNILPYYGVTDNAAAGGLGWDMTTILPTPPGLDIQGVIYSYRIRKETGDWVTVYVQNELSGGGGYIFRERDEWKPGSLDNTGINRVVPVIPGIPRDAWGRGSVDVQGPGSVEGASVRYQYRVDPCFDPQSSPSCPGYKAPMPNIYEPQYAAYDPLEHSRIAQFESRYSDDEGESEEDREAREEEENRDSRERLEKALAAADTTALFAQALALSAALSSVGPRVDSYYAVSIAGGVYPESVALVDTQLPDSKSGLRNNLAQQLLHEEMISMQYD